MIFLLSYTDDDFGARIIEQLMPYVSNSSFEDYFVCFRFSTGKAHYAEVYKRTRTAGSDSPSATKIISSKISSLLLLQIAGQSAFDRNLFSKLMSSTDYIISTFHKSSTTQKSKTLLDGMRQVGNTNVKLVELELMEQRLLAVDLDQSETDEQNSEETEGEWNFQYVPAPAGDREGLDVHFIDFPLDKPSTDISFVLGRLRLERPITDLPGPNSDQNRDLRDAGRELVPLVAELQAIKSKYQSDDVADMQVNEGYKSIEQIWRRIWFGHTSQNPTQSNQYGHRIL